MRCAWRRSCSGSSATIASISERTSRLAAGREVGVDRELERRQPQLLEPADLDGRERLVGDVVERRAAPQRERLARLAVREQLLEVAGVDVLGRELQLV